MASDQPPGFERCLQPLIGPPRDSPPPPWRRATILGMPLACARRSWITSRTMDTPLVSKDNWLLFDSIGLTDIMQFSGFGICRAPGRSYTALRQCRHEPVQVNLPGNRGPTLGFRSAQTRSQQSEGTSPERDGYNGSSEHGADSARSASVLEANTMYAVQTSVGLGPGAYCVQDLDDVGKDGYHHVRQPENNPTSRRRISHTCPLDVL